MKRLLITLLAAAGLAASPIVFSTTKVVEVKDNEASHVRPNVHSTVDVVILRFDGPILRLGDKIAEFEKIQAAGITYNTKDAASFFSKSRQVVVEFAKSMGDAAGNPGSMESWHRSGVPVTSVSDDGKKKTTTVQSIVVTTGASAFVSVSDFDEAHLAKVALKIHQIVKVSGTDVSPYFGDTKATLRSGQILPMFWTNSGTQYCAFLVLHMSQEQF
ncbi:hypothetical protein [Pseudomonas poae]|uniref:hypothetical protein n=1 Tax=Pseudomonas poae TaxID=200451 RepID=UPI0034D55925